MEDMCRSYDGNDAKTPRGQEPPQPRQADPNAINAQQLGRIADLMPQLQHLMCKLTTEPVNPALQYRFPPSLRSLEIAPIDDEEVFALLRRLFEGVSPLASLQHLSVWIRSDPWNYWPNSAPVSHCHPDALVAPLDLFAALQAGATSLQTLRIRRGWGDVDWNRKHIQALLTLPQLTVFHIGVEWTTDALRVLASAGSAHTRLKDIGLSTPRELTSTDGSLLGQLVSLEVLSLHCVPSAVSGFLSSMTRLTKVRLGCWDHNVDELVEALQHCPNITRLSLDCKSLTGTHLASLLPALPQLHTLILVNAFRVDDLTSLLLVPTLRVLDMDVTVYSGDVMMTDELHLAPLRQLSRLERLHIRRANFASPESEVRFRLDSDPESPQFRADLWPHLTREENRRR